MGKVECRVVVIGCDDAYALETLLHDQSADWQLLAYSDPVVVSPSCELACVKAIQTRKKGRYIGLSFSPILRISSSNDFLGFHM